MWNWLINDSPSTYQTAIKHQNEEQLKTDTHLQQHHGRQATSIHTTYQFCIKCNTDANASINEYVCIKKCKQAHHEGLVTICYNVNNGYLWRRKVMPGFYSFFVLFCFQLSYSETTLLFCAYRSNTLLQSCPLVS